MWTVIQIAPNMIIAEQIKSLLMTEGVMVNLRTVGIPHLGDSGPVEVMVPESEAEDALEILNSQI